MKQLIILALTVIFSSFNVSGKSVVFPFENMTEDSSLNWLGTALEITLEDSMESVPYYRRLELLERMDLPEHADYSLATKIVLAKKAGAECIVTGSFQLEQDNLSIRAYKYNIKHMTGQTHTVNASFMNLPTTMKPLVECLKGEWKYSEKMNSHFFEKYIKGWIIATNNDDFTFLEQVIEKTGGFDGLFRNLGHVFLENENYLSGFEFFSKLKSPDYPDLFYTAMCALGLEDFEQAKEYFEKAMNLNESKELFYNIAGCLHELKRDNEALFYLSHLKEQPGNITPEIFYNKALIHASLNQYGTSLDLIQDFITHYRITDYAEDVIKYCCVNSGFEYPLCNLLKGREYEVFLPDFHFLENPGEYKGTFGLPAIKTLYLQNAKTCIELKKMDKAREYLEKILIFEPNNPEVLNLLCSELESPPACEKLKKMIPEDAQSELD